MRALGIAALLCIAVGITACGGSETTTVIKEAPAPPAETVERTTTVEASPPEPTAERSTEPNGAPPNVEGLPLPEAQRMLKQAGYRTVAKNTDTTFGIIVPDNYTICNQGKPRGTIIVVLAQKYGC